MMNRKDFVAVAAAIKSQVDALELQFSDLDNTSTVAQFRTVRDTANSLANVFADANPKFNRNTFLAACGIA